MSVHPLGSAPDPGVEPIPLVRPAVADPARVSAESIGSSAAAC